MGCSPPGSSVHGIVQARILEWVADSLPSELPGKPSLYWSIVTYTGVYVKELSHILLFPFHVSVRRELSQQIIQLICLTLVPGD